MTVQQTYRRTRSAVKIAALTIDFR